MTTTEQTEQVWVGLADCHGVESFRPLTEITDRDAFALQIRARANDQRHALVYQVTLTEMQVERIKEVFFKGGDRLTLETAAQLLTALKQNPTFTKVAGPGKLDLIPNHHIDPWYSE